MNALIHVFHSLHIILGTKHIGLTNTKKKKKWIPFYLRCSVKGCLKVLLRIMGQSGLLRTLCQTEGGVDAVVVSQLLGGVQLKLENALPLQVGVCVVTAQALGVLAHVAALGARLRRRDEVREDALVASDGGLENVGHKMCRLLR